MSIKYVCEQTATEAVVKLDPLTMNPRLPEGWVQEVTREPDGSITTRHFVSPEQSLAWHQAND